MAVMLFSPACRVGEDWEWDGRTILFLATALRGTEVVRICGGSKLLWPGLT